MGAVAPSKVRLKVMNWSSVLVASEVPNYQPYDSTDPALGKAIFECLQVNGSYGHKWVSAWHNEAEIEDQPSNAAPAMGDAIMRTVMVSKSITHYIEGSEEYLYATLGSDVDGRATYLVLTVGCPFGSGTFGVLVQVEANETP